MPSPDVLLTTKPVAGSGFPIGLGDWRLTIEIMLPENQTARWGQPLWGSQLWSGFQWFDLSPWFRGAAWHRGTTEFDGNPEIGELVFSLDNGTRQFSPWNTVSSFQNTVLPPVLPAAGPNPVWGTPLWGTPLWGGTLPFATAVMPGFLNRIVRVVAHSPTGMVNPVTAPGTLLPASVDSWTPQFTGYIESWVAATVGTNADSQIDVTVVETASTLAQLDVNALTSVQGDGDLPGARIARLANAASWELGYTDAVTYDYIGSAEYTLQSTDMARNRWGEIVLTAESVGAIARTHRNGTITLYNKYRVGDRITTGPEQATTTVPASGYVGDSQIVNDNNDNVINDIGIARAGGSQQFGEDLVSKGLFKTRTMRRTDFLGKSDGLILNQIIRLILNARSLCSRRLEEIELHSGLSPATQALIIAADLHDRLDVQLPPLGLLTPVGNDCTIDALDHQVSVTKHGLAAWTTTITFGAQSAITP